jgi:putative protease
MSSVIGNRSGNRGKCAQPCRKNYSLYNNEGILVENKALLSMKDLMTLEHIDKIIETGIHSLKIEGRMKSKEYVYTVVSSYRKAIDSYYDKVKYSVDEEILYNTIVIGRNSCSECPAARGSNTPRGRGLCGGRVIGKRCSQRARLLL